MGFRSIDIGLGSMKEGLTPLALGLHQVLALPAGFIEPPRKEEDGRNRGDVEESVESGERHTQESTVFSWPF